MAKRGKILCLRVRFPPPSLHAQLSQEVSSIPEMVEMALPLPLLPPGQNPGAFDSGLAKRGSPPVGLDNTRALPVATLAVLWSKGDGPNTRTREREKGNATWGLISGSPGPTFNAA